MNEDHLQPPRAERPHEGSSDNPRDRVVFWDFDGTLAWRDGRWSETLAEALRVVNPNSRVTGADLRPELTIGFPWHAADVIRAQRSAMAWWSAQRPLFVRAYLAAGVSTASADRAADLVPSEYYRPEAWTVDEDAVAALTMTRTAGYRNVVLSNHAPELPQLVDDLGLESLVDLTITSATVGAEKPNEAIFRHALEVTGAGRDVWMVGDNPVADVAGAEAIGIRAILITPENGLLAAARSIADEASIS